MENRIIDHLITNVKLYTGKDLETVGLESEYENYKVSFYGLKENNYRLLFKILDCQLIKNGVNTIQLKCKLS